MSFFYAATCMGEDSEEQGTQHNNCPHCSFNFFFFFFFLKVSFV